MKLALFGHGRMGRAVEDVAERRGHEITLILDDPGNGAAEGFDAAALGGARMAIDFSTADAALPNVLRAAELGVSIVVGTTGWDHQREEAERAVRSAGTGLLVAPNFSLGMFLFVRIVEAAARMVDRIGVYDVHLTETHHRHKVDHPSGTARRLADLLVEHLGEKEGWTTDLSNGWTVDPKQLHVGVARVGEVPGVHTVGIEGPDDRLELRHEARGREAFARGAVLAAEWLEGRTGVFSVETFLDDLLGVGS